MDNEFQKILEKSIYKKVVKRVNTENSHQKDKKIFLYFNFSYLYEMINVNWTYCGNHLTVYVNQTVMLMP